jgi:hypothetical protein
MAYNRHNIRSFADTYIFGFMCADIESELELARSNQPAGNFLCALGLLCYTEFMGGLLLRDVTQRNSSRRFNKFFSYMGKEYKAFDKEHNVYDIFRCGLAHEYFVKRECTIIMLNSTGPILVSGTGSRVGLSLHIPDSLITEPLKVGVGQAPNGRYFFIVEQYYKDFRNACERLVAKLEFESDGGLPPSPGLTWWTISD